MEAKAAIQMRNLQKKFKGFCLDIAAKGALSQTYLALGSRCFSDESNTVRL